MSLDLGQVDGLLVAQRNDLIKGKDEVEGVLEDLTLHVAAILGNLTRRNMIIIIITSIYLVIYL